MSESRCSKCEKREIPKSNVSFVVGAGMLSMIDWGKGCEGWLSCDKKPYPSVKMATHEATEVFELIQTCDTVKEFYTKLREKAVMVRENGFYPAYGTIFYIFNKCVVKKHYENGRYKIELYSKANFTKNLERIAIITFKITLDKIEDKQYNLQPNSEVSK